ncbi:hypothetical protein AGMMS4956_16620 [Bacteroidia bacterium]|nr:hypothetical protein AGMMS4956_16620 [Bacteroidia bacterium]
MEQQEQSKMQPYAESMRYLNNAEETLQKAVKEDGYYKDRKYVRAACGIAYLGVLEALDTWLQMRGVPALSKKQRKSIEFYTAQIAKLDGKLSIELHTAYRVLHIEGYYDGVQYAKTIRSGFDVAYNIIARIKPAVPEEELQQYLATYPKKKTPLWRQFYSFLFL